MNENVCNDNRFNLIAKYKAKLIEATNIETSQDEMAVIDNILFRMWQMGWLDKLDAAYPWRGVEEPPKEEGRYWCAKKFAGHWIFFTAWYWNNVSDYTGVPVGKEEKADGFVFGEDVVHPDYWMPIEPPKEDA